jgi:hypothetical protein
VASSPTRRPCCNPAEKFDRRLPKQLRRVIRLVRELSAHRFRVGKEGCDQVARGARRLTAMTWSAATTRACFSTCWARTSLGVRTDSRGDEASGVLAKVRLCPPCLGPEVDSNRLFAPFVAFKLKASHAEPVSRVFLCYDRGIRDPFGRRQFASSLKDAGCRAGQRGLEPPRGLSRSRNDESGPQVVAISSF